MLGKLFAQVYRANANPAYFGAGTKLTVIEPNREITEPTVRVLNVSDEEVCKKENVTLVCVAEGFYPDHVNVYWTVNEEKRTIDVSTDEAATQDGKFYNISSRLNINYKDEWTKGKTFSCTVQFYNGTVYSNHSHFIVGPTNPNMNITRPTITLLPPSPKELCRAQTNKGTVTLVCLAKDFYPDHINIIWQVNGKERNNSVATDYVAQQAPETKLYSISSRLQVNQTEWTNVNNKFTCVITFYNGDEYERILDTITFLPVRVYATVKLGYLLFLGKSLLYAVYCGNARYKIT
ncbi:T-cell receptor beta chain C region [Bagarius yarrelli]|nr:T-cell receptor beta chain C region [Bagarius yarrelli]